MIQGLQDHYHIVQPGGAFYLFPECPWGNAQQFVEKAIELNTLVIPGNIFSEQNTHFRISYAVDDRNLNRGIESLQKLATLG